MTDLLGSAIPGPLDQNLVPGTSALDVQIWYRSSNVCVRSATA